MGNYVELTQKYKLALLQLQECSDNNLIIQEGLVLNIENELKDLEDQQMTESKKTWTLYLEDFSNESPECENLFKKGELTQIYISY